MTNRDKWLEIAEAFGTPYEERTERQKHETRLGLCHCFYIDFKPYPWFRVWYWWPVRAGFESYEEKYFRPIHDEYRCLFACFMAEVCDENFESED